METVGLAGSVLLAAPVALYGGETLAAGGTAPGIGYLVVAAGMVAVPYYLTTPDDVATGAVERAVGRVVQADEETGDDYSDD
jgi:hypothetical protein